MNRVSSVVAHLAAYWLVMPPVDNPAVVNTWAEEQSAAHESALRGLFLGTTRDYCTSSNIYHQATIKSSKAKEHRAGQESDAL